MREYDLKDLTSLKKLSDYELNMLVLSLSKSLLMLGVSKEETESIDAFSRRLLDLYFYAVLEISYRFGGTYGNK